MYLHIPLDQQLETLIEKGCPQAVSIEKDFFSKHINLLLRKEFRIGSIIVIPGKMVEMVNPLSNMMSMIEMDGKNGYTHIDINDVYDAKGIETSYEPYLIHDVEDGGNIPNISLNRCGGILKGYGRFGLNVQEGIAMVTHNPWILKSHCIYLTGSRFKDSNQIPVLGLINGHPTLCWDGAKFSLSVWGVASCTSRGR